MKIPRDKLGRFINYDRFLNRDLWVSFYYNYGEEHIDLLPTKIIITEINNYNIEFTGGDTSRRLEIFKIRRYIGHGSIELFDTEDEAKEFYNSLIQDEIDDYKDKIDNLKNKFL